MMESTNFKIELNRILDVLCREIYDSPFALLRENVQNAYDAILMRKQKDPTFQNGSIKIELTTDMMSIVDNGIGMDEKTLSSNYWTAGSSGKNNDEARKAGVVGTFGIGAMANFGVCSNLEVITRALGSEKTITSGVKKEELSLSEKCIKFDDTVNGRDDFGTTVKATLNDDIFLSLEDAKAYIRPYVNFLPIPVYFNGELLSLNSYKIKQTDGNITKKENTFSNGDVSFRYCVVFNNYNNALPQIYLNEIKLNNSIIEGDVCLKAGESILFGLRNGFGLAPVPLNSVFNLGGVINLAFLTPTAGREAISRECINIISTIYIQAERIIAEAISESEIAENSRELLQYIRSHGATSLTKNIQIKIANSEERLKLGDIDNIMNEKKIYYFQGSDKSILKNFDGGDCIVLIPSEDSIRRSIQLAILRGKKIEEIPDSPTILNIFNNENLDFTEIAIATRIRMVIEDDYLLPNCEVRYAEISHGLSMTIEKKDDVLIIYMTRNFPDIVHIKQVYKDNFSLFEPFIKDLVRVNLYPKFSQYVPSSTKDGAEALFAILQRKKELYTIESSELGNMEYIMKDYLVGKAGFEDVLRAAVTARRSQTQMVDSKHVGDVNEVVGTNTVNDVKSVTDPTILLEPLPPIMRTNISTDFKILRTDEMNPILNSFQSFLAFSEKMFRENYEFFLQPHTTRIIWSMHKIIYVFSHASSNLTLYYDMELHKKLDNNITGGKAIPSTTIITKDKIFIPIIPEMNEYFNIKSGQRKFYVRYDSVKSE